tara:strand:+ start:773 stop:2257 length:1485 start_codon:yes stop_codon:yes gene_type:complete
MALVTISFQPQTNSCQSSYSNIDFTLSQTAANTVNVIATCQYNDGTGFVDFGGSVRVASNIVVATTYNFDAQAVFRNLPKGNIYDMNGLGMGDCQAGNYGLLKQDFWKNVNVWKVRVKFQREYLDATTNTVVLDTDITTSAEFFVYEAAVPLTASMLNQVDNNPPLYLAAWTMRQYTSNASYGWNWLTDNIVQKRYMKYIVSGDDRSTYQPMYITKIRPSEQYYIHCINATAPAGHPVNVLKIDTMDEAGNRLNQHNISWTYGMDSAGFASIDVGFRSIIATSSLTANSAEGTDFVNVDHYYVYNNISDATASTANVASVRWRFDIDRNCTRRGKRIDAYQRFAWKNVMGAYDFFTSNGMVKTERKYTPQRYERRVTQRSAYKQRGKQNYQNTVEKRWKITSHEMSNVEAEWFSKMLGSAETYVRWEFSANSATNPQSFSTFDLNETNRDAALCNIWVPIVIETKSIQISDTKDNSVKLKFTYSYAQDDIYVRG